MALEVIFALPTTTAFKFRTQKRMPNRCGYHSAALDTKTQKLFRQHLRLRLLNALYPLELAFCLHAVMRPFANAGDPLSLVPSIESACEYLLLQIYEVGGKHGVVYVYHWKSQLSFPYNIARTYILEPVRADNSLASEVL